MDKFSCLLFGLFIGACIPIFIMEGNKPTYHPVVHFVEGEYEHFTAHKDGGVTFQTVPGTVCKMYITMELVDE